MDINSVVNDPIKKLIQVTKQEARNLNYLMTILLVRLEFSNCADNYGH
jgi:uncharacterized membrane protein